MVLHVIVALAIVGLILLQQGKGADMGASFGGGGSQTLFGPSGGGNLLTRATAVLAAVFFATSFGLAIIAKQKASMTAVDELIATPTVVAEQVENSAADAIEASFDELPDFEVIEPEVADGLDDAVQALEATADDAESIIDNLPE
jgi:preprotein translocase subunit SecG